MKKPRLVFKLVHTFGLSLGLVTANNDFHARVGEALSRRYEDKEPPTHIEQRIYDGFPSDADNLLIEQFHGSPWKDRYDLCGKFNDEPVGEFGLRVVYCEQPTMLPKDGLIRSQLPE